MSRLGPPSFKKKKIVYISCIQSKEKTSMQVSPSSKLFSKVSLKSKCNSKLNWTKVHNGKCYCYYEKRISYVSCRSLWWYGYEIARELNNWRFWPFFRRSKWMFYEILIVESVMPPIDFYSVQGNFNHSLMTFRCDTFKKSKNKQTNSDSI